MQAFAAAVIGCLICSLCWILMHDVSQCSLYGAGSAEAGLSSRPHLSWASVSSLCLHAHMHARSWGCAAAANAADSVFA